MPREVETLGVKVEYDLDNLHDFDVVYLLRIQQERMAAGANFLPSLREYAAVWGVSKEQLRPGRRSCIPARSTAASRSAPTWPTTQTRSSRSRSRPAWRCAWRSSTHDRRVCGRRGEGGRVMRRVWSAPAPRPNCSSRARASSTRWRASTTCSTSSCARATSPRSGRASTAPKSVRVVDAAGWLLLPGFVDLHVHLRVPGREDEEDIASGTRAAAAGGYVAVFAMANTDPVVDTAPVLQALSAEGRGRGGGRRSASTPP